MPERGHKRKRSLQDAPIDLSKMRVALNLLDALKEDLDGIQETEGELDSISKHILALEDILKGAKKPVCPMSITSCAILMMSQRVTFSTVKTEDLKRAGVVRKRLAFEAAKVTELAKALTTNAEAEILDLHSRIKKIYARVNMDVCPPYSPLHLRPN